MDSITIFIAALGVIALLVIGLVTLFFGMSADRAEDFPFYGKRWPRIVVIGSL